MSYKWLLELPSLPADLTEPLMLLGLFSLVQFLFHSVAPLVLRDSGATAMQLSLLTADFYSLLVGIVLLQYKKTKEHA
ncbi:unnamed protein product [Timema podura]|uniref:Solute carrier family 66 member 3 n=1 Tax=Timema podura TaxID=61482 RepID=A0ABN7NCH2_TIMPD|nr:unnamed protein product [Timema podura]